jgi:hypothetical protein
MVRARMIKITVPRTPALPIAPTMALLSHASAVMYGFDHHYKGVNTHGTANAALLASSEMETAQSKLQMVHTGAKKLRIKANPDGHPVRFVNPPNVNWAVLSWDRRAIGRPMMVTRASKTFRTTLGVCSRAKAVVQYPQ